MPWIMAAAAIGGSILSSKAQKDAAESASDVQSQAAALSAEEQKRQFDTMINLLSPYTKAGGGAVNQQQNLLGLSGDANQQASINQLKQSPLFQTMFGQGQNALSQNAMATGGMRGGNIEGAMSQFSPQMLSDIYQSQLANLGGLSSLGQSAAGMQAQSGQTSAANIANLLAQQGAAQAGGILAKSNINTNMMNGIYQGVGSVLPNIMSSYSGGGMGEYFPTNSHVTPRSEW